LSIYEAMFLVDNRHANRDWERVVTQAKEMVTKHGGVVIRADKWGERKLAYPIKGNKRGTYLLVYFESDGDIPNRVYREVQLSETYLRALILEVEKAPEGELKPLVDEPEVEEGSAPRRGRRPGRDAAEDVAEAPEEEVEAGDDEDAAEDVADAPKA